MTGDLAPVDVQISPVTNGADSRKRMALTMSSTWPTCPSGTRRSPSPA